MGKRRVARRKVAAKWIKGENDERAVVEGCWFDEAAGTKIVEFFPDCLVLYEGQFAGKPFELQPWQRDELIMPLFGWKRDNGLRRFRRASWWLPKKNGKTAICGGLLLVFLMADGERGARVLSAATDRPQAAAMFENAKSFITHSPEIQNRLICVDSKKRIAFPETMSYYQALSADAGSNEGPQASCVIRDELHAWSSHKGRRLHAALKFAGSARLQPMMIDISTAGEDRESLGYDLYSQAKKIKTGEVPDTQTHVCIYEADEKDNWTKESTWRKANPSLGVTLQLDDFKADCEEARRNPAEENSFLRYRLNLWVRGEHQFIKPADWQRCVGTMEQADLLGKRCCGAIDLSLSGDISAWMLAFKLRDDLYALNGHYFVPEEGIIDREYRDGVPYRQWAREGWFTLIPGNVIDLAYIRKRIDDDAARFKLGEIAYDPALATQFAKELEDGGYMPVVFRQGYLSMGEPCAQFGRLARTGGLIHFGDPALRWMVGNAVAVKDPHGLEKLSKSASKKRIDGAVTAVMAVARAMADETQESVYENEGAGV